MARIGHSGLPFKPRRRRLIFAHRDSRVLATPEAKQTRHESGFSPGSAQDFDYCQRLYFAEMEGINRKLKLDRKPQGVLQRIQRRDVGCNSYDVIVG
jgi:hypothetical protein